MTNDDFDPEMLRRLDAPRRPSPAATASIRAAMLDAFDDEVNLNKSSATDNALRGDDPHPAPAAPTDPTNGRHLEIALDPDGPGEKDVSPATPKRTRWQIVRYAAIAAAVAAAVAGIVVLRSGEGAVELVPVDTTNRDADAVRQFCLEDVDPLVDDLVAFERQPGGELSDRALRNGELLAQRYRDLADRLGDDLAVAVVGDGDALLQQAADARRQYSANGDDAVIGTLIDDTVASIAALPGSGTCRFDDLQDSSS